MNNLFYHFIYYLCRGQTWSKFYHLDSTHIESIIYLLISIDICQEIELTSITHVNKINFITDNDVIL